MTKKYITVCLRINEDYFNAIEKLADELDCTKSAVMRFALGEMFSRMKNGDYKDIMMHAIDMM